MTRYLFQANIGPVQDFISSARRARDLWFGSEMLSKISKAVARKIKELGGNLIFPYSSGLDSDLVDNSEFNVANVIIAEYDNEEFVKAASAFAKAAADNRWRDFIEEAHDKWKDYIDDGDDGRWNYQRKASFIEFYSAWYPFDESNGESYKEARQQVSRLVSARKNIRDFEPWDGIHGVPKSSLDGQRESVLKDDKKPIIGTFIKKKRGESLDLIGCVKRVSGGRKSFPSTVRVAVDSWLRGLAESQKGLALLEEMKIQCDKLHKKEVISKVNDQVYNLFPYEGSALLPSRYREIIDDVKASDNKVDELPEIEEIFKNMEAKVSEMRAKCPFKGPYLAVLSADGDKMGKAISELETSKQHREFSEKLSSFAKNAGNTVRDHHGVCIYAGGDDVYALLPVDMAVQCARALYDLFASNWDKGFEGNDEKPTLSVGIAVVHTLEDLGLMRKFAKDAEHIAKIGEKEGEKEGGKDEKSGKRNALAISVRARGNAEISIRERWNAETQLGTIDERLQFWIESYENKKIPKRFAHELLKVADFYKYWEDKGIVSEAMKKDIMSIFKHKDVKLTKEDKGRVEEHIKSRIEGSYESIVKLANELIIAQWLGGYKKCQPLL